nr:alpha/beta hydrolase [Streptomyces sp. TLI_235]
MGQYRHDCRQSARLRSPSRAAESHRPVLVLRAQCDYVSWNVTREYRDLLPNAVLLPIPDAGHRIHINQPQEYQQAVRAFLLDEPLPGTPYTGQQAPW